MAAPSFPGRAHGSWDTPTSGSGCQHGCVRVLVVGCSEAALQRVGSGRRPVATPAGPGGQPLRLRTPNRASRLVFRGWPPCSPNEGPASKKSPKGEACKTSCTAVTGNGCWITNVAAEAAEVSGRRNETEKYSETQRGFTTKPTSKSIKSNSCPASPGSLAFLSITWMPHPGQNSLYVSRLSSQ